jgi:hypothetical protein
LLAVAVAVCAATLFVAAPDALESDEPPEHALSTAATKRMAGTKQEPRVVDFKAATS